MLEDVQVNLEFTGTKWAPECNVSPQASISLRSRPVELR